MNKKTFHKKWYHRLLQSVFWGSFIFLIIPGIWTIFHEDDMPVLGVVWIVVVVIVFWFVKRLFDYVMFGDKILRK